MKSRIFLYLFCIILQSCVWSSNDKDLTGGYYLSATDSRDQMEIQYKDDKTGYAFSVVNATVFAVGYDNKFIIVKQHPRDNEGNINKAITNYFIIPVQQKVVSADETMAIGPMTLNEFNQKKKELNITNINFNTIFNYLK